MQTKHITLAETLARKDPKDLHEFVLFNMNAGEDGTSGSAPITEKIVEFFHKDVFAAATRDLVLTEFELEDYFIGMIEDGSTRIPKDDEASIEVFKRIVFIDVGEVKCGRGTSIVAVMADEVREAILADHSRYEELRCLKDDLDLYGNSAAVLYGVVTLKEICDLYRRWNPDTLVTEDHVRMVLDYTQLYEESEFFLHGDKVCNLEFDAEKDKDEIIDDFISERDNHPRWYPKDGDEFTNFCEESALLETDEAHALDAFLEKHGVPDVEDRTALLYGIVQKHQFEERISSIITFVTESCPLEGKNDASELIGVLVPFLNTTHLRVLNGWTPDGLHASFVTPAISTKPRVGRNDPCPCGSGLKYKKCCGRK